MTIDWVAAAAFIFYLLLVIGIGIFTARFSSTGISEFFIGGRKISRFIVALSAVVSGRSAWLLLGVTGMAYRMGASAVWTVIGYITVELFLFVFYARRLRRFSEHYDCITLPDFYAARFGDRNGILRIVLTLIILTFMLSYVSAQFVGGGKAFAASFHVEQDTGILLTALIVLIYTMMGGFLAVSVTDMLQAIFMIVALVVLPVYAIFIKGGLEIMVESLNNLDPTLIDPFALSVGAGIGFIGIGLGSPGNPHIIARYMSINDPDQLRISALIGTIWNVIMAWGALFIGLAGRMYYPEAAMLPEGDTEQLYPFLAEQLLHPVFFGIIIASIFAAIMSTADSQLLVAASAVVRDIYQKIIHADQNIPQKRLVLLSRIVLTILVMIALGFGYIASELVFWLVLFAWAGLGAALGPTSILALYWRKTTRAGIFAGLFTGTIVTFIWYYTPFLKSTLYELVPAFILSLVVTYLVSRVTKPPAHVEESFTAMKQKR